MTAGRADVPVEPNKLETWDVPVVDSEPIGLLVREAIGRVCGSDNHPVAAGFHPRIGQPLARTLLNVGSEEFLERIPDFRVADGFTPKYATGSTRHVLALPLVFDASRVESDAPQQYEEVVS